MTFISGAGERVWKNVEDEFGPLRGVTKRVRRKGWIPLLRRWACILREGGRLDGMKHAGIGMNDYAGVDAALCFEMVRYFEKPQAIG